MSGQLINIFGDINKFLPWISFVAGIGGSLHCVGMCGGLVTATCSKSSDIFRYQTGRLLGYLFLGLFAGFLSQFLNFKDQSPLFSLIPAILMGGLLIFWGYQSFFGRKAEIKAPKLINKLYFKLWDGLVSKNKNFSRSFFIGLISIFLPCGLLYGIVIGAAALNQTTSAIFSMFFFWLGTLPSMVLAPQIVQKLLNPLKQKIPKIYSMSLIFIGVLTISYRMVNVYKIQNVSGEEKVVTHKSCH